MIGLGLLEGIMLLAGLFLLFQILFLVNLQRTLERVSPERRKMAPGLVWLQIIPLFGFFWFFYVVIKVRDSVREEFSARGWSTAGDFGVNIGFATGVLQVIAWGVGWTPSRFIAMQMVLYGGGIVCWVIYWARVAALKHRMGPPQWFVPGAYHDRAPYPPPYAGGPATPGAEGEAGGALADEGDGYDDDDGYYDDEDADGGDGQGEGGHDGERRTGPLCPGCGTHVKRYDRFCYVCGSRLPWDR